jgi:hypothetical protein
VDIILIIINIYYSTVVVCVLPSQDGTRMTIHVHALFVHSFMIRSGSGVVLVGEDVEEGEGLGDGELEPELGPVVVVEDRAEGVLLQWVADLPRCHPHLYITSTMRHHLGNNYEYT